MIGSLGGHFELLLTAAPTRADYDYVWITSPGVRIEELRSSGRTVRELPRLDRGTLGLGAVWAGIRLAFHERPTTVITSGAGLAVPFCLVSWLFGARLIFIETMARVRGGSRSGQLLAKVTDDVIVQWPELAQSSYPGAHVAFPTLLEGVNADPDRTQPGAGTFVTVGSHDAPFDRLLRMVDDAVAEDLLPRPVFVQHGVAPAVGAGIEGAPFIDPDQFGRRVREASLVITHGGAGAIATALRSGAKPLVISRSAERGEHVDDHQSEIVEKLADLGLIVHVTAPRLTRDDVAAAAVPPRPYETADRPTVGETLESLLDQNSRSTPIRRRALSFLLNSLRIASGRLRPGRRS